MPGILEMDENDDDNEDLGTSSSISASSLIPNGESQISRQPTTQQIRSRRTAATANPASSLWAAIQSQRSSTAKIAPRRKWAAIALGQVIALAAASTNAVSYSLSNDYNLQIQIFQLVPMYLLLSAHLFCREPIEEGCTSYTLPMFRLKLRVPWLVYLFIAVLDVVPNLLQLLSFRFTSLTSTTLLGSLTVPSTMVFSYLLLAKRFFGPHYLGACLCVVGGIVTGWSDSEPSQATELIDRNSSIGALSSSDSSWSQSTDIHDYGDGVWSSSLVMSATRVNGTDSLRNSAWVGDLLAISAALLYGLGDAVAEYSIKHIHRQEYLGMIGLFGAILTAVAFPFVDGHEVSKLWTEPDPVLRQSAWLLLLLYTGCVFFYYVSAAWFYTSSDATLLNLSLLTSNLWVLGFSVLEYRRSPPPLFYVAAALVVSGVIIYQKPSVEEEVVVEGDENEELAPTEAHRDGEVVVLVDASHSRTRRNSDYESI